uniref:Uncharacterized protein n=1 Tax=Electrophorus electricus TaxID=8005 RepID=A0A4W4GW11_ELEEL
MKQTLPLHSSRTCSTTSSSHEPCLSFLTCCTLSSAVTDSGSASPGLRERSFIVSVAHITVMCVLALTVVFGVVCLVCNLLIKSEGMINVMVKDRRSSKDVEAVIVGSY